MSIKRTQSVLRSLSPLSLAQRLHRDERGSLSIMGVFAIFFLTVLLGMIFNVGRQVDDKLRMQNAADAAAYSGTLTVSRGMNAIAYSNHLLCEIIALTAYMREARLDPNSSELPDWNDYKGLKDEYENSTGNDQADLLSQHPEIATIVELAKEHRERVSNITGAAPSDPFGGDVLDVWRDEVAQLLKASGFEKFEALGEAIEKKVRIGEDKPNEQNMVRNFERLAREHSKLTLSVFEYVLSGGSGPFPIENEMKGRRDLEPGFQGGLITRFQRSVVLNTPQMSQSIAEELVERHGRGSRSLHDDFDLTVALYRMLAVHLLHTVSTRFRNRIDIGACCPW
jgi:hypothetical protein